MAQRGVILITALWLAVFLGSIAVSLGMRVRFEARMTGTQLQSSERSELMESAVQAARLVLEMDRDANEDNPREPWYGPHLLSNWLPGAENFEFDLKDEESKLNLNLASPGLLRIFFETLERKGVSLETDAEDLAASIARWRGETPAFGSPSAYHHKGAPLESVAELLLIEHITPRDYHAVQSFVTVFSRRGERAPKFNINTVSEEVLETVILSLAGDSLAKSELSSSLRDFHSRAREEGGYFELEDLSAGEFMQRLQLTPTAVMIGLVNQLLPFVTVDSIHFCVDVRAKEGGLRPSRLIAVIGPTGGRPDPFIPQQATVLGSLVFRTDQLEILSWRETA